LHHLSSYVSIQYSSVRMQTHRCLNINLNIYHSFGKTDRSFRYASPCLWNQLPSTLRQPHPSPSVSDLPVPTPTISSHAVNSLLSPSISPSLFHSRLETYISSTNLSHHRFSSCFRTDSTDFMTGPFLLSIFGFCLFLVFSLGLLLLFVSSVRQTKLDVRQIFGAHKYSLPYRKNLRENNHAINLITRTV